jgi:hypothetical protein
MFTQIWKPFIGVFQIYLMYMTYDELSCIHNFYLIRGMIRIIAFSSHANGGIESECSRQPIHLLLDIPFAVNGSPFRRWSQPISHKHKPGSEPRSLYGSCVSPRKRWYHNPSFDVGPSA